MHVKSLLKTGMLLCVLVQLSACSMVKSLQPSQVYQLPPAKVSASQTAPMTFALRIDQPQSTAPLNSEQIARVTADHKVDVYGGARWVSPAPRMVRDYLLDAFSREGRIAHLSHDGDKLKADYELVGTLSAFQSETPQAGQAPVAAIRLHLQLVDVKRDMIIAGRHFEYSQAPTGAKAGTEPGVDAVVAALGLASNKLAGDVSDWVVKSLRMAKSTAASPAETQADGAAEPKLRDPAHPPAVTF